MKAQLQILIGKLSLLTVVMFAFAMWVMPPLYQLFCEVTGIGLQPAQQSQKTFDNVAIDPNRRVRVQFLSVASDNLPLQFASEEYQMSVPVGVPIQTKYIAKNLGKKPLAVQAIPNVTPYNAVDYFHKTECFCFQNQSLVGGESADLGLVFIIDPNLPKAVKTITLSYTMFEIEPQKTTQLN